MDQVKKFLALLLCIVMCVSLFPTWAFAADEEPENEEPMYIEPVNEEPVNEEPVNEEPVNEEPVNEEPVNEEPVNEEPVNEKPVNEEPVNEDPANEEPVNEEPVSEEPVNEEPVYVEPVNEEPVNEEPVNKEPVNEEPVNEEPVNEDSANEEPVNEEPVNEEPVNEEPVNEEPVNEEPVNEEPVNEEPVNEEPVNEEPVNEEPVNEEPVNEEPVNEEPLNEEPVNEEPVITLVRVIFTVAPAGAEVSVYGKNSQEEKTLFYPEIDGSYLLVPGEYYYTLKAENYVAIEDVQLIVTVTDEPIMLDLAMTSIATEEPVIEKSVSDEPVSEESSKDEPLPEPIKSEESVEDEAAIEESVKDEFLNGETDNETDETGEIAPDAEKKTADDPSDEEETVQLEEVCFLLNPETASVRVYLNDAFGDELIISPQLDGTYSLLSGTYYYDVTADGYIPQTGVVFSVEASDVPLEIPVSLEKEPEKPVPVQFVLSPENAEVRLYLKDGQNNEQEIAVKDNGTALLFPGVYYYVVTAEGYTPSDEAELIVQENNTGLTCTVSLEKKVPGSSRFNQGWHTVPIEDFGGNASNEELLKGFAAEALYGDVVPSGMGPGFAKKNFGATLSGNDARLYKTLKSLFSEVANGKRSSTVFSIPVSTIVGKTILTFDEADNVDFNLGKVVGMIMADCPYEQYWFDKTTMTSWSTEGSWVQSGNGWDASKIKYVFVFPVAEEYATGTMTQGVYSAVRTSIGNTVNSAVNRAKSIVNNAVGYSDTEKLRYYGNQICALTEYNDNAAYSGSVAYGNPWQLIWVFDGDSSTTVVCEGYSKAFQYLCDLTSFDRNIACYCLEGDFVDLTYGGGGPHMWNAVTMDNGVNYLVDVTHNDNGGSMFELVFLLKADSGNATDGYTVTRKDGTKAEYKYNDQSLRNCTEEARTITTNTVYLPSPILRTAGMVTGGVKITWEAVSGAEKYKVYRKTGSESWKQIAETTATNYTDKSVTSGNAYTYTVRALKGTAISGYDKTGKTVAYIKQLSTPVLTGISNVNGGVKITWNAVTGAAKYRVFRKSGNSSWTELGDTTGTTWTNKSVASGTKYTYTVRCVTSDGKYYASAYDTTGRTITYIAAPVLTGISNVNGGVKITWNKSTGAAKYRVLRKSGSSGWTELGDTTGTTWTNKSVASGTKYTYTVRCVSSDGNKNTSAFDSTGKTITYIAAPVLTGISNVNGGVKITWNKSTGAAKYRVFRKTGSGHWTELGDTTALTYTDQTVKSGTYAYTVRCVTSDGKSCTSAYDTNGKSITYSGSGQLATPQILSVNGGNDGVEIKWNKVTGAAKYRVFRKTGSGHWTGLGDTTATTYTDKSAKTGTQYSYTIRCVTSDGKSCTSDYDPAGKTITYLSSPVITSISGVMGKATIKWNAVSGAAQYKVFYKTSSTGSWSKVGDTTGTSITHKDGVNGYYYTVRCVSADGKYYTSRYDTTGKTASGLTLLPTPKITSVNVINDGVEIKWNAVTNASKYRVFRKTGSGHWTELSNTTALTYTDKSAGYRTQYSYTIRCVTSDGKHCTSGYDAAGKTITCLPAPTITSVNGTAGNVTIKWDAVSGAAQYKVFYKTSSTGSWNKVGDTTGTSIIHSSGANGYYYTVRCVSSDGKSYTSGYDTTGKRYSASISIAITSASIRENFTKTLSSTTTVSYKQCCYTEYCVSNVPDDANYTVRPVLNYYDNGCWTRINGNTFTSYDWDGTGMCVEELTSCNYPTARRGQYQISLVLTFDGTSVVSSTKTLTY